MAKLGILPPMSDMFGPGGQRLLDEMDFPGPYGLRVESLRDLLEIYGREIALVEREIAVAQSRPRLSGHPGLARHRSDHRGDLGGRDRRRPPVPPGPASVLVGRDDPQAFGVRHHLS